MKIMSRPDAAKRAKRRTKIEMVAGRKYSATALSKLCDGGTLVFGQAVSGVYAKEPYLIDVLLRQIHQEWIIARGVRLVIARYNLVTGCVVFIP